jgi:ATP-dependent Clp protease, protease subunit
MIDTINYIQPDVATYIIGQAASMGSIIATCGTRGKRFALRNSRNLMHQPLIAGVMEGQATDLEIEAREMLRIRERIYEIYAERTGQPKERIERDCDRNKWLDDEEMLEYGLVDKILTRMTHTPMPRRESDDV